MPALNNRVESGYLRVTGIDAKYEQQLVAIEEAYIGENPGVGP